MSVARRSFSFRPITRFLYSGIFRFAIENQSIIYYNAIENLLPTEYGGALWKMTAAAGGFKIAMQLAYANYLCGGCAITHAAACRTAVFFAVMVGCAVRLMKRRRVVKQRVVGNVSRRHGLSRYASVCTSEDGGASPRFSKKVRCVRKVSAEPKGRSLDHARIL